MFGKPRKRKHCSLAFSIRKNRQSTIKIKKNKIEVSLPKLKKSISGRYNFLPNSHDYEFKLGTLKMDACGTLWLRLTVEENVAIPTPTDEVVTPIVVGVDMGLKTTRTAVAVNTKTEEVIEVYQPERVRYFERGYQALVWASTHDKRGLPFVHRKIARQRSDNIGKDIEKIMAMGDIFKFGKPNSAFLQSGRLARSAADAANSLFCTRFAKRAELAGKKAGEIDESYTSVTCRKCRNRKPMPLSLRIFECESCDHIEDRDVNSAYQISFRPLRDEENFGEKQKSGSKNGKLSCRGMKPVSRQEDFQELPPLQAVPIYGAVGASSD
jgi:putative transposase